jgi:Tfp pilus assembly protein PilF
MALSHRLAHLLALVALAALTGCASAPKAALVTEVDARIALAKRNVGLDYLANGRVPMATRELQQSHQLNPEDPVTVHWLGEAYRRRGLYDTAMEQFQTALLQIPADPDLRLNLAGLCVQMKRYAEAVEHSQFLIDDPTFNAPWTAFTNKGWAEFKMGKTLEARMSLEEALAFRPEYWPARLNLGIVDAQEGRKLQAIMNFEKVLERNIGPSAEAETNYRLGETYVSIGRRDKAVHYFKLAAEGAPYDRWGQQSEKYLKLLH